MTADPSPEPASAALVSRALKSKTAAAKARTALSRVRACFKARGPIRLYPTPKRAATAEEWGRAQRRCTTELSRYNSLPYCSVHEKKSDPSASADAEGVTDAAPAGRETEEGKVAAKGKKARLLEHLEKHRGEWCDSGALMKLCACTKSALQGHICILRSHGIEVESRAGAYRLPVNDEAADCQADEAGHAAEDRRRELYVDEIVRDAVAKSADHDPAPTPLGAAPDTSPEQARGTYPAAPLPSTPEEPPAAGIDPEDGMTDEEAADRLIDAVFDEGEEAQGQGWCLTARVDRIDPEVSAIRDCVDALWHLDLPAKRRVLAYLTDRELCS